MSNQDKRLTELHELMLDHGVDIPVEEIKDMKIDVLHSILSEWDIDLIELLKKME